MRVSQPAEARPLLPLPAADHDRLLVSVIVPVHNGGRNLLRLIEHLRSQTLGQERFEVIIADDGSTDGMREHLPVDERWLRLSSVGRQNSYAARNRGAAIARAPVLAFTDADCMPDPAWLDRGLSALQAADLVAGQIELLLPTRPTVWSVVDAMLFDQERFVSMGKAATANIFVSRALFERRGRFDETLPSGGDWEFVSRSLRSGDQLTFAPTAIVRHHTRDDALDFLRRRWRIEHAFGRRAGRSGLSLVAFNGRREAVVPRRFGFAVGYDSRRAAAVGISAVGRWRLRTAPARYLAVPAVDVLAQGMGWASARLRPGSTDGRHVHPSGSTAALAVSVVIPTRQRRDHVVRAVRSVLAQTHPAAEVIVVDDGSTDGTAEALAPFGGRIVYLRQNHAGASAARNLGVRHARGEIVAFLDDDDRWRPEHLSAVADSFALHPTAAAVSLNPGFSFDGLTFSREPVLVQPLPRLLIGSFVGYPSATAVRREALITAGGFDEGIVGSEGYDMWLRLGCLGGFVLSRRHTVIRRRLDDSIGDAAVADGRFLAARERTGETAQAALAPLSPELRRATDSYRRFVASLRALQDGDEAAAAAALADACRLDPDRSREPWLIAGWMGTLPRGRDTEGQLWTALWFAEHWPDPRCATAVGLRLQAAFRALRLRRPRRAAEILWHAPHAPLLRFTTSELARAARAQLPRHGHRRAVPIRRRRAPRAVEPTR